jgi:predicted secreted protein
MINKKITASVASLTLGALMLAGFAVLPVSAQTVGASASTTIGVKAQANAAARLAKIIATSDTAISARITDLNKLNSRIQALKNVSSTEKTSISNEVQTNISGLTSLKAKIDADTDVTTAQTDSKSIYGSFRIYALVIPQGYIAASADRVDTIVDMMTAISAKLQARITADQTAGKNVTALQASLTDLNAKIADAKTQASTAQSGIASLTPDQGNKTQLDANIAALKASRANIKTATHDLTAARQDAKSIIQGLKALNVKTSANASASTTVSH